MLSLQKYAILSSKLEGKTSIRFHKYVDFRTEITV